MVAPDYWCPYSCPAGHERDGFVVDILSTVLAKHGIRLRYLNENYSRAVVSVRQNIYQVVGPSYPDEVPGLPVARRPITYNRMCFYTLPSSTWKYQSIKSLEGIRLGVIQGYKYGTEIDTYVSANLKNEARIDLNLGEDLTQRMVAKMQVGRFGSFLEDRFLIQYLMHQTQGLQLREAGCLPPVTGYLAFSPAGAITPQMIEWFDAEIPMLVRSGKLKSVLDKYGLPASDWLHQPLRQQKP